MKEKERIIKSSVVKFMHTYDLLAMYKPSVRLHSFNKHLNCIVILCKDPILQVFPSVLPIPEIFEKATILCKREKKLEMLKQR